MAEDQRPESGPHDFDVEEIDQMPDERTHGSEPNGRRGRIAEAVSRSGRFLHQLRWRLRWWWSTMSTRLRAKVGLLLKIGPSAYWNGRKSFLRRYAQLRAEAGERAKRGQLEAYAETGTEGFCWSVYEDGKSGYDGLHSVDAGDRLIIFRHDGSVAFDGLIDPDHDAGYLPYPMNPEYGQPEAFGLWIHWTQRGWKVKDWAALFFHGVITTEDHELLHPDSDRVPYRAILVKTDQPVEDQGEEEDEEGD